MPVRSVLLAVALGLGFVRPPLAAAAAPVWDLLGLVAHDPKPPDERTITTITNFDESRRVVATRIPHRMAYPIDVPAGAILDFGYAIQSRMFTVDFVPLAKPARFRAVFIDSRGADHVLHDGVVDLRDRPGDRKWFDVQVDLREFGGTHGTLAFEVALAGDASEHAATTALFSSPRVLTRAMPNDANVLLITIDCLRADHVGSYGYHRRTTPALDALAADGIRFSEDYSTAPMTMPSLAQMYTSSVFPQPGQATFISPLAAAGIPTAAFVNNVWLVLWLARSGVPFDRIVSGALDATAITDDAIAWLEQRPHTRFAMHLHYLDAHTPYAPPEPYARLFVDRAYPGPLGNTFGDVDGANGGRYGGDDRTRIMSLYDGAIRYVDANIGRLLEVMKGREILDHTVVVVTADHGEEFWDHGHFFHGQSLYDELLHVPLIVRLPGGAHSGTVVPRPVRSIDIAPAILQWAGITAPTGFAGRSLAEAVARPDAPPDDLFATATTAQFPTRYGIRTADAKVVTTVNDGGTRMWDLRADPREHKDILPANPTAGDALAERLAAQRKPLEDHGWQMRVVGPVAGVASFRLSLQSRDNTGVFETLDRTGGPLDTRVAMTRDGSGVRVKGHTDADGRGFRIDRRLLPLTAVAGKPDPVRVSLTVNGVPRPEMVRLGVGSDLPANRIIDTRTSALEAEDPPKCPPPVTGVRVCLWHEPVAQPEHAPAIAPVPDAAARERLRALGYVQ